MARQETTLKAFVASPSDVQEERALLEQIVRELNTTWSETFAIRIDLIRWETHAYPDIASEPQEVIERQIEADFDIFIGIMWGRFGQATKRFGSGTEQEFNSAYDRYKQQPDTIHIMFYFKEAGIAPSEMDPQQLAAIQLFKKELGQKGTLYWTFKEREEFAQLLRLHFSRVVQDWTKRHPALPPPSTTISTVAQPKSTSTDMDGVEAEELGFLDFVEQAEDEAANVEQILIRMGSALDDITGKMKEGSDALAAAIDPKKGYDVRAVKRIVNRTAQDMNNFSARIDAEVPLFSASYKSTINAISQSASHIHGFTQNRAEDIAKLLAVLDGLLVQLRSAHPNIIEYRETIGNLPIATVEFRKAKRTTHNAVSQLADEFDRAITITSEARKLVEGA